MMIFSEPLLLKMFGGQKAAPHQEILREIAYKE
jgi:hypothetical protein